MFLLAVIAEHCQECKNFNSLFAIISGLGHGSVQRLKQTWDKLPSKYLRLFEVRFTFGTIGRLESCPPSSYLFTPPTVKSTCKLVCKIVLFIDVYLIIAVYKVASFRAFTHMNLGCKSRREGDGMNLRFKRSNKEDGMNLTF